MSSRVYQGTLAETGPSSAARALPWLLGALTIGLEITYPLVDGEALRLVTIGTVVAFAAACVTHALVHRGVAWALGLVAVSTGGGLVAEAVGVHTGMPFGAYSYTGSLGPRVLAVPLVVPLAWTMMTYPVLLAARRLTRRWTVLVGAFGLAAWDVSLDPQMVGDGHWTWAHPSPGLPGIDTVPLTNVAGWLAVGVAMMAVLVLVLPGGDVRRQPSEALPALLLGWTWLGYIVGNIFWFGTLAVAVLGGVLLGMLVLPYLRVLWRDRS